jgi:hypothetical protein
LVAAFEVIGDIEGDDVLPVVVAAGLHHRAVGVDGVQQQAQWQLGVTLLQPPGRARERLQLAVLLGGVGVGVLDELAVQGDRQALGRDQLGLQHVVVVQRLLPVLLFQAVGAVAAVEAQLPGAVEDGQEVAHQPAPVQRLHAHQAPDHLPPQRGQRRSGHAAQEVVEGVGVGHRLLLPAGQGVEVGQRLGAVQLEPQPPPRAELEQEAHQAHPQQEPPAVGDAALVAAVLDLPQPLEQVGEEVGDGLGQGRAQG